MRGIITIMKKDLRVYFSGPSFYVIAALFTGLLSYTYYAILSRFHEQSMFMMMQTRGQGGGLNLHNQVFLQHISNLNLILLFFTPFLTVRLFAEEKKLRTFDLLLTSPVTATQIVLGKYLAGALTVFLLIFISALYPVSTSLFADVQWGLLGGAYLGLVLLSLAYVSVGVFCSSLTDSVVVAGIMSIILSLLLWFVAWSSVIAEGVEFYGVDMKAVFEHISVATHFSEMVQGKIQSAGIVFFGSIVVLYCFLTQRVVESARWR